MIGKLTATTAILLAGLSPLVSAKDDVEERLSKNWYATEVIVFQRGPVMGNNSSEKLVLLTERHFPFEMRAFVPKADQVGSFYDLDPLTRATLVFPTFDIELDGFSFLVPTDPEPTTESTTMPGTEPAIESLLISAENEIPGRPPPVIEPVLEPNPLLDFLAALASFERSLDERSYRWLPVDELQMQREASLIEARDELHILLHGRWIQPVPERNHPEPLLVQNGASVDNARQLEGIFSVTLGRYLHFQATLWYREPALGQLPVDVPLGDVFLGGSSSSRFDPAITLPDPDQSYMLLSESRRLRSHEIHYLDHPKLGIVVRIDPVAIPEELTLLFEALEEADE